MTQAIAGAAAAEAVAQAVTSLEGIKADSAELVPLAAGLTITDVPSHENASSLHSALGNLSKKIEERRKFLKQPHTDAGKLVDSEHNPIKKDVDAARAIVGTKILTRERELDAIERKRLADEQKALEDKAAAEEKANEPEAAEATLEQAAAVPQTPARRAPNRGTLGRTSRRELKPEITVDDINLVPGEFIKPREVDTALLLAEYARQLAANGDADKIKCPGVTFTRKWTIAS